jgi:ubiquitin C-terminal hydrolase
LTYSFLEVLENLWENNGTKDFAANNFNDIICKMNPLFKGVQAIDSKDLLIFLLENMHKELNRVKNVKKYEDDNADKYNFYNSLNSFINYFKSNYQSIISDIFYGIYNSQMKCLKCKVITHNIQCYNILIFPLEEVRKFKNRMQNTVDIIECFEYYQKEDYMMGQNQIYCNNCHIMANSVNISKLIIAPNVLVINLNRGKGLQFDIKIKFGEFLDIKKFVYYNDKSPTFYELIGIVTHFGPSSMGGHFIAFCKSFVDQNWYKYNDAQVDISSFQEASTTGVPYILIYSIIQR